MRYCVCGFLFPDGVRVEHDHDERVARQLEDAACAAADAAFDCEVERWG